MFDNIEHGILRCFDCQNKTGWRMQPENKGMFEVIEHACLGLVRLQKKIAGDKSRKERHLPHHRTCLLGNGLDGENRDEWKIQLEKNSMSKANKHASL